jgi:hypothetical protein
MTWRALFFVGILVGWQASAAAEDAAYGPLTRSVADAAFGHMALTFVCQPQLGEGYYHAARSMAEGSMELAGYDRDEAILLVDKMDKKFKADKRKVSKDMTMEVCLSVMADTLQKLKVAQAELRVALKRDAAK